MKMRYVLFFIVALWCFIPAARASRKSRLRGVIEELSAARAATQIASWAQPNATRTQIMGYVPGPASQMDKTNPVADTFGVDDPGRKRRRPIARYSPWREGLDGAGSYTTDGPPFLFFRSSRHSGHPRQETPTSGH